ncbi:hypothetical protein [Jannaschia pohangensis]|uniref:Uncharacterized protein n=1 Tax=Jannaschia pohangensis TaxID=390807 RepID=A0A1I3IQA8_9RHOB|nr:hypothetical protein [Jannaschia pohangensis]SFI50079.1 hypothetical protein SAMN04488095_1058 [Jannaschia pohangensis]
MGRNDNKKGNKEAKKPKKEVVKTIQAAPPRAEIVVAGKKVK